MKLHDEYIMPWGKFKGKSLADVPVSYIDWLRKNIIAKEESRRSLFDKAFLAYCNENTDALRLERMKVQNQRKNYE